MANENSLEQGAQTWPVPQFHFSVEISNVGKMSCKEVSGLDVEMDVIEYRSGDMHGGTKGKIPGLRKCGDVTLKKVMFKNDQKLWDWICQIKRNTVQYVSVIIDLLDESGSPVQRWKLSNACPLKYTVEGLNADSSNVLMETVVLSHEGVTVLKV